MHYTVLHDIHVHVHNMYIYFYTVYRIPYILNYYNFKKYTVYYI